MKDSQVAQRFADLRERIDQTSSIDELYAAVASLRDVYDVEHAIYHSVDVSGRPYALATYGPEWSKHYEENRLYLIDPVVKAAFTSFTTYDWRDLSWSGQKLQRFRSDAIEGGVGNQGLSLPIRGPGGEFALVTMSNQASDATWTRQVSEFSDFMVMTGHYLHEATRALAASPNSHVAEELSPRERDALSYLSKGMNRGTIADHLNISEHTLRVYVDSARRKLGAHNTLHAVACALKLGVIAL